MSQYDATVSGDVRAAPDSSKKLWDLTKRPVPNGMGLRFVAKTTASPPYELKWQVVNTGEDALADGRAQLPGGFDNGHSQSGDIRREGTAYRGHALDRDLCDQER